MQTSATKSEAIDNTDILKNSLAVSKNVNKLLTKCNKIYHSNSIIQKQKRPGTAKLNYENKVESEVANEGFKNMKAKIINGHLSVYSSIQKTENNNFMKKYSFKAYFPKYSKFGGQRKILNQSRRKFRPCTSKRQNSTKKIINIHSQKRNETSMAFNNFMVL